ncbi:hypothetical protein TCDM_10858 [Trypanosoma cruzi Dm28c]|uniref:Uncharacterized protein n=2 Tax=Trypanosoma cruzi TaxID=5693 RepID=V5B1Z2_TRYCR|nr:hypothetical protein TCDM_10858 [Trypanosoma cruzi Dm28c]PWU97495.1 hypothetical protein C4B63_15g408 [Trypanosoma cruzi]
MQMKKQCFSWTARWTVPRRRQLRLDAEAGASRHTTRYFLVGCFHGALHHGDEAIAPCPAPAQQRRILLSTWQPIQHRCGGSLVSAHPQNTNASHFSDVLRTCVPLSTRNLCRRPCIINWRHQSRLREMLLLMDYTAYVTLLGYPTATIALLLFNIVFFLWDTVRCNKVEFNQPRFANDTSDDVKRTALDFIYSSLGVYDFELWTDVSSSLAELASGSAALLYGSTTTTDLPVEVHRAAAGRLTSSYRAECLATENGIRHLIPFVWEHPNRPYESWWLRTPCRQLRHSASSHWPCEAKSLKRVGLCCSP